MRRLALVALMAVATTAHADCPPDFQAATELRITLERADAVWAGQADGVLGMAEVVRNAVACAPSALTPLDAARVHRTLGLAAAAANNPELASRLFSVVKGIEPQTAPPSQRPAGPGAITLWNAATPVAPLASGDGDWRIDGVTRPSPATGRASVTQRLDGEAVVGTAWLDAGDPVPLTVACDVLVQRTAFEQTLLEGEAALAHSDADALSETLARADEQLICLVDALSGNEAAHLLRLHGARRWLSDPSEATPWLAAARALQPRYQFPSDVLPPGSPLARAVTETVGEPPVLVSLPPARGMLLVDGEPQNTAPSNRPWVVQHVENGEATVGALVLPGATPPSWPAPITRAAPPAPRRKPTMQRLRPTTVAADIGALALIGIGTGLWAGANHSIHIYCPPPDRGCPGDLGDRAVTQRTIGVSLVFSGAALGVAGAVLTRHDVETR